MNRILVVGGPEWPLHGAAVSRAALLATHTGAGVVLFDPVYNPHLEGYYGHSDVYDPLRGQLVAERAASTEVIAAKLRERGLQCEARAEWAYPPHLAVARVAATPEIELVVFEPGDRERGLSNEEWRRITICPAPVLVARSADRSPYTTVVAAVDPQRSGDKPSALDGAILEQAKAIQAPLGARLEAVHCVAPLTSIGLTLGPDDTLKETEAMFRRGRKAELEALARENGLPPESVQLIAGRPDDVLAARSAAEPATLLVLGSVSRGPIARLVLGSTAERVLRNPGGDVLVVKPPGFGFADDPAPR